MSHDGIVHHHVTALEISNSLRCNAELSRKKTFTNTDADYPGNLIDGSWPFKAGLINKISQKFKTIIADWQTKQRTYPKWT